MRPYILIAAISATLLAAPTGWTAAPFDVFEDATLRVDFYQVGNAERELIVLDRLIRQGPWAGPRADLTHAAELGRYAVELRQPADGQVLFALGFDSYFGEYRTTGPARDGVDRAYHNTVLVPMPRAPALLVISSRQAGAEPVELLRRDIDPASIDIAAEPAAPGAVVVVAHEAGPPSATLDIAIVGEGYQRTEEATFRADLERVAALLLGFEPYASHRQQIAIRGVLVPSAASGIDEPTRGRWVSTAVGASFNSLGSERYLLTEDNRALRDVAANVPYDLLIVMINDDRYGGGGIFNAYCTFTAHSQWADYLLLHELGHSFAGLADEYYSSDVAYNEFYPPGVEPAEPNITALLDPATLKWRELVAGDTPIPTPWGKAAFDAASQAYGDRRRELNEQIAEASRAGASAEEISRLEGQLETLAEQHAKEVRIALAAEPFNGAVGAFEGAGYASTGLYRPMLDCLMFSRGMKPFCRVCERAVGDMIRHHTAALETPAP